MKELYIPRGTTLRYETLACTTLINHGVLVVEKGVQARRIIGRGVLNAGSISAGHICAMELEASSITADTLAAERVCAAEVKVRGETLVSCYLDAEYVQAGKLTVAGFQVQDLRVDTLRFLSRKRGLLWAMLEDILHRLLAFVSRQIPREADITQPEPRPGTLPGPESSGISPHPQTDGSEGQEDFEFLRLKAMYQLLRRQGYTLRIIPRQAPPPSDQPAAATGSRAA